MYIYKNNTKPKKRNYLLVFTIFEGKIKSISKSKYSNLIDHKRLYLHFYSHSNYKILFVKIKIKNLVKLIYSTLWKIRSH